MPKRLKESTATLDPPASRSHEPNDYWVDHENCVIHGVKLGDTYSRNKRRYTTKAMADIVRVANNRPVSTTDHGRESARSTNGQIRNPRMRSDGKPIGDWHLEKNDPLTKKWLESADRFRGNISLSLDTPYNKVELRLSKDGTPEVVGVKHIEWFSLVLVGGQNRSLSESFKRRKRKMPKRVAKRPLRDSGNRLIERFNDLPSEVTRFIESACAEMSETDVKVKQTSEELEALRKENEELKSTNKQLSDKINATERLSSIRTEFAELTKDIDPAVLKDAGIELTDDKVKELAAKTPAEATSELAKMVSQAAVKIQESLKSGKRVTESFSVFNDEEDPFDDDYDPFVRELTSNLR